MVVTVLLFLCVLLYTAPANTIHARPLSLPSYTLNNANFNYNETNKQKSPEHGGFIGVLDYKDLAAYILEVFHKVPHDVSFDAEMVPLHHIFFPPFAFHI